MKRVEIIIYSLAIFIFVIALSGLPAAQAQTCTDNDGDSFFAEGGECGPIDCDDYDVTVYPGAPEVCDGKDTNCDGWKPPSDIDNDGDGVAQCANDCNDSDPGIYPGAVEQCDGIDNNCDFLVPFNEKDMDGDGSLLCDAVPDCNDYDSTIYPGNQEVCGDNKDNDCDGNIDEPECACPDLDGDGFTADFCGGTDCDDDDPAINPDAEEECNDSTDNDCDGLIDIRDPDAVDCPACTDNDGDTFYVEGGGCGPVDCDDSDKDVHPDAAEICDGKDSDCDGWKSPTDVDIDKDGVAACAGDCNDNDPLSYPGAVELCDGKDNNCNYITSPDEMDADGDGYRTCDALPDCNDNDSAVNPGNAEICGDGKDNDCDSVIDETDCVITCLDNDGDGYGTNSDPSCLNGPVNDCNDNNPAVNPGASEGPSGAPTCTDTFDNNCDGLTDSAQPACMDNCIDSDGDGYGSNGDISCPEGTVVDCDDSDENVYPGAAEICDSKDSDCDGWKAPTDVDNDGDGVPQCANDCNDYDADIYPGAPEQCDGKDNNCDYILTLDERDLDGDGYLACAGNADCDDNDPFINPGSEEWCLDNKDNNCNGQIDEQGCICPDADGDGFTASFCGGSDCDDTSASAYPGAVEECNDGLDNDCDGLTDIKDPDAINCPICTDEDIDGYYIEGGGCGPVDCDDTDTAVHPDAAEICDGKDTNCDGWKPPTDRNDDGDPVALCAGDCDDNNPDVYPGNIEHPLRNTCDDGIDNDCNSLADAADPSCMPPTCDTKTSPKDVPHFFTLLNTDDTVHPDSNTLICEKCHAPDFTDPVRFACERCHADPTDMSNPLNGTLKEQYPLDPPYGYGSAPNVAMHSSETVGTKYGVWTMGEKGCVTCHNPHAQEQDNLFGTDYGMYIKEHICFDNDVTGERIEDFVELTSDFGSGSFADGQPHNENVCETCHTRTNHHQRDGSAPGGQSHFDGVKCTTCHLHGDGFKPSGNCLACHNQSPPAGSSDTDRRQVVEGTPGDGSGEFVNGSHHVTDETTTQVVNEDTCQVCHDLALHTIFGDGVSVLLNDQDGGESYIYDGTGGSIEGFCVSCHDSDGSLVNGAEPFIESDDINNPPDVGWTTGGVSHSAGDACFNCHGDASGINAHGSDSEYLLKYNNYTPGAAQAFCNNCHNGTVASTDIETISTRPYAHGVKDCQVCHNQHTAEPGTHAPDGQWYPSSPDENTNNVSGVLTGASGVELTVWPVAGGLSSKSNFTLLDAAEKEYQICFKCHAKTHIYDKGNCTLCHYNPNGSFYRLRSGVRGFNPNNKSAHPVVVSSANQTGSYIEDPLNPEQMVPQPLNPEQMSPPWTNTGNQTMYCTDCHGADNEDTVDPRGPHGSEQKMIIKGTGKYWPTGPDGFTVWRLNTDDADNPDLFCKNCHPIYSDGQWKNNVHQSLNHNNLDYSIGDEIGKGIPCVSCHNIVPHGGRRSRLIAYSDTLIPEYVNIERININEGTGEAEYVNVPFNAIKGFKKEERFNYQIASCFTAGGLGCHLHEQDGGALVGGYDE